MNTLWRLFKKPKQELSVYHERCRAETLEFLGENKNEEWWKYDCSFPMCDIPRYIAMKIITIDEVMEYVNKDYKLVKIHLIAHANSWNERGDKQGKIIFDWTIK